MKFTLVAAVIAMLALAHGSLAQEVSDLERLSQMFEDMKTQVAQRVTEILRDNNMQEHVQTVQEHVKTVVSNVESQLKPVTDNLQSNVQPVLENFQKQLESIFQTLAEHGRALGN